MQLFEKGKGRFFEQQAAGCSSCNQRKLFKLCALYTAEFHDASLHFGVGNEGKIIFGRLRFLLLFALSRFC